MPELGIYLPDLPDWSLSILTNTGLTVSQSLILRRSISNARLFIPNTWLQSVNVPFGSMTGWSISSSVVGGFSPVPELVS